jgi:hypothetical protein
VPRSAAVEDRTTLEADAVDLDGIDEPVEIPSAAPEDDFQGEARR